MAAALRRARRPICWFSTGTSSLPRWAGLGPRRSSSCLPKRARSTSSSCSLPAARSCATARSPASICRRSRPSCWWRCARPPPPPPMCATPCRNCARHWPRIIPVRSIARKARTSPRSSDHAPMTQRALVHRISASAPDDMSGIDAAIAAGRIDPKGVVAVLAKTEGNGLVNDFSRGHATLALSLLFERHLPAADAKQICLVMSGGTEGGMAPHWVVFERRSGDDSDGRDKRESLAIGRAHTPALPFEQLGRVAQVDQVAAGVLAAMRDAGITDPAHVHFVQVKCPLLIAQRVGDADRRGVMVVTRDTLKSMGL